MRTVKTRHQSFSSTAGFFSPQCLGAILIIKGLEPRELWLQVGALIKGQPLRSVCFVVWFSSMQDAMKAVADAAAPRQDLCVCDWVGVSGQGVGGVGMLTVKHQVIIRNLILSLPIELKVWRQLKTTWQSYLSIEQWKQSKLVSQSVYSQGIVEHFW